MRFSAWQCRCALASWFMVTGVTAAQQIVQPLAGWYEVHPQFKFGQTLNFQAYFRAPVVGKNKDNQPVYSQTVHYDAPTALVRAFDFTMMRDPAVKLRYGAEFLRAQENPPQEFKVAKYPAWRWQDKIVVVLDEDKAVILARGARSENDFPLDPVLDSVDWDKIARALTAPPRTDFTPTLQTFKMLTKGAATASLQDWCGPPSSAKVHADGPGLHRWLYRLADGSQVIVAGGERIVSIRHETKDGKVVYLVK